MQKALALLLGVLASAEAYMVAPVAPRSRTCSRAAVQPEMILGYKLAGMVGTAAVVGTVVATKKLLPKKKEDSSVTAMRSSLAGMDSLSGLSEMSLEREEGREGLTIGVWKEYTKNDGRKWYYNTETKTQTWIKPEEFIKKDAVSAAATAKNEARGV